MEKILEEIQKELLEKEESLSVYATKSKDAIRLKKRQEDIRPAFFHDIDTILHSTSYTRSMGKTQVYSFFENDHISKRMVHVQLVSKIARTIGRCLNLNEDLIEAIALGHDIGHTPIGHEGEHILNEISLRELKIPFLHNLQSVRTFMVLKDSNLSIQVLDGMMCHNGEILNNYYRPQPKTKEQFLEQYRRATQDELEANKLIPMTLEGCVVRISDMIAYIGRDIEDAISLGKLDRNKIPKEITKILGNNNREIVNTIILDIVKNSYGKDALFLSPTVFEALNSLKNFNYQAIYYQSNTKEQLSHYKEGMNKIYQKFLKDIQEQNFNSLIYQDYLQHMTSTYMENTNPSQMVIDFIAGMTDGYFKKVVETVN